MPVEAAQEKATQLEVPKQSCTLEPPGAGFPRPLLRPRPSSLTPHHLKQSPMRPSPFGGVWNWLIVLCCSTLCSTAPCWYNQPPSGVSTMATGKYYKSHASPPLSPKSWCTSILLPVVLTAPHRVPAGSQVSSSLACAFLPSTILGSPSCPHPACGLPPCRV